MFHVEHFRSIAVAIQFNIIIPKNFYGKETHDTPRSNDSREKIFLCENLCVLASEKIRVRFFRFKN